MAHIVLPIPTEVNRKIRLPYILVKIWFYSLNLELRARKKNLCFIIRQHSVKTKDGPNVNLKKIFETYKICFLKLTV